MFLYFLLKILKGMRVIFNSLIFNSFKGCRVALVPVQLLQTTP